MFDLVLLLRRCFLSRPSFIHSSVHFTPQIDPLKAARLIPTRTFILKKSARGSVPSFCSAVAVSRSLAEFLKPFFFSRSFEKQADVSQSRCPVCKIKRSKTRSDNRVKTHNHCFTPTVLMNLFRVERCLHIHSFETREVRFSVCCWAKKMVQDWKIGGIFFFLHLNVRLTSWNFIFPKVKRRHDLSG